MTNASPEGGGGQGAIKWIVGAGGGVLLVAVGAMLAIVLLAVVVFSNMTSAASSGTSILALKANGTDLLSGTTCNADTALDQGASGGGGSTIGTLSSDQLSNAQTIIGVAKSAFATEALQKQAAIVGLMTAMQESTLKNISYGDNAINPDGSVADSVGLFQQQHFWGTKEQRMDPKYSSGKFYQALAKVKGWSGMQPGDAAQAVQGSGFPLAYAKWQSLGKGLVDQYFDLTDAIPVPSSVGGVGGTEGSGTEPGDVVSVDCSGGTNNGEIGNPLNANSYTITAGFGPRKAPCATCSSAHMGVDMATPCGSPVFAASDGEISVAGAPRGTGSGYGNVIFETVGSRTFIYGHLDIGGPFKVDEGDKVKLGQQIGVSGNTGDSTGCHLHFEIRDNGTPTDPMAIYEAAGVKL